MAAVMPSRGPGLGDVLDLALKGWQPRMTQGRSAVFGAAGRPGFEVDYEIIHALGVSPAQLIGSKDLVYPMGRLLSTQSGQQAANAVGNEERTIIALERLSVEALAQSLRLTKQATDMDRLLVIPALHGRPPVLLLMSPHITDIHSSRIVSDEMNLPLSILQKSLGEVADPNENSPEALALRALLPGGERAVAELFLISQPEIVLTRRPEMIRLCVASPLMQVDAGEKTSTAGVICRDAEGDLGVTACYHGTGPVGTAVTVGCLQSKVKRASEVQDLVFVPLASDFEIPPMVGLKGVQQDREPAKADWVHFDGVTNRGRTTRVFGTDNGLLRARPTIMLKLQTDPDTDQGDSGCALLDKDDRVLGFAFERTAYDDYPAFTDWIWAANALRALQLKPIDS